MVRNIYIYLNRKPGTAVEPKLREFLRFILSRDAQRIVADNGSYLPLTGALVREQLGEDAVILSSRRTGEGVEVTAAVDFDATTLEAGGFTNAVEPPPANPLATLPSARSASALTAGISARTSSGISLIRCPRA